MYTLQNIYRIDRNWFTKSRRNTMKIPRMKMKMMMMSMTGISMK
jgi:hypothetical protein